MMLLRYVDTYDPSRPHKAWIITNVRRYVGKLEANKDSYTDASKGSDTEYATTHSGYKAKYRPKKAKDFVNVYDNSVFKEDPDEMHHDGANDHIMDIVQALLPHVDFGGGSYNEIISAIKSSEDIDVVAYFMKEFDGEKHRDISEQLGISVKDVKNSVCRADSRLKKIVKLNDKK